MNTTTTAAKVTLRRVMPGYYTTGTVIVNRVCRGWEVIAVGSMWEVRCTETGEAWLMDRLADAREFIASEVAGAEVFA
ncbi:MAG: hypothetical protein Q4F65_12030 [Propionibacteriaceae bacterium]|nr:hypothetical protein [Propionibacteriaceae bacterium]